MTEENVFTVAIGIDETAFKGFGSSADLNNAVRVATKLLKAQIYTKAAEYKCTVEDTKLKIMDLNQILNEIDKAAEQKGD